MARTWGTISSLWSMSILLMTFELSEQTASYKLHVKTIHWFRCTTQIWIWQERIMAMVEDTDRYWEIASFRTKLWYFKIIQGAVAFTSKNQAIGVCDIETQKWKITTSNLHVNELSLAVSSFTFGCVKFNRKISKKLRQHIKLFSIIRQAVCLFSGQTFARRK